MFPSASAGNLLFIGKELLKNRRSFSWLIFLLTLGCTINNLKFFGNGLWMHTYLTKANLEESLFSALDLLTDIGLNLLLPASCLLFVLCILVPAVIYSCWRLQNENTRSDSKPNCTWYLNYILGFLFNTLTLILFIVLLNEFFRSGFIKQLAVNYNPILIHICCIALVITLFLHIRNILYDYPTYELLELNAKWKIRENAKSKNWENWSRN